MRAGQPARLAQVLRGDGARFSRRQMGSRRSLCEVLVQFSQWAAATRAFAALNPMAELSTVKDDAPTKHAVSVTWFRQCYLVPAQSRREHHVRHPSYYRSCRAQPVTEHSDCGATQE